MAPRSFSPFRATRYVASVDLIDVGALAAVGVRLVLLDRDNTCVPRDTRVAPPAVREWLGRLRAAGIATCMLSNNFHSGEVAASACELGCPVVDHAMKPAPFSVWVAMARMGVGSEQTVIVGDQVFTDVLAGNRAGAPSSCGRSRVATSGTRRSSAWARRSCCAVSSSRARPAVRPVAATGVRIKRTGTCGSKEERVGRGLRYPRGL